MNKLLIVENDSGVRESLVLGLSDSFSISEAASADDALAQLEKELPDVVLVDQHMQKASGMMLLERLSRMERRPAVVLYSASMDVGLARQALWLGVNDCASKPFSLEVLKKKLGAALQFSSRLDFKPFMGRVAELAKRSADDSSSQGKTLDSGRENFVQALLQEALQDARGDMDRAADRLGLSSQEFKALSSNPGRI